MAAIKDIFLERYQDTLQQAAAQIASILRQQVPYTSQGDRPQRNPYATGRLYNSINWRVTQDNRISITYNRYGTYTDFGTYGEANTGAFGIDPFELPRFAGYSRRDNQFGIAPQYWTSLRGQDGIIDFLVENIAQDIEASISTTATTAAQS